MKKESLVIFYMHQNYDQQYSLEGFSSLLACAITFECRIIELILFPGIFLMEKNQILTSNI